MEDDDDDDDDDDDHDHDDDDDDDVDDLTEVLWWWYYCSYYISYPWNEKVRTWKDGRPQEESNLPTINCHGRHVSLRDGTIAWLLFSNYFHSAAFVGQKKGSAKSFFDT